MDALVTFITDRPRTAPYERFHASDCHLGHSEAQLGLRIKA
jgi:hypothetical protein